MKKISIMVPCYNEEENVVPLSEALIAMFEKDLPQYDYEILFIDNDSRDTTRVKLRALCENNKKSKRFFIFWITGYIVVLLMIQLFLTVETLIGQWVTITIENDIKKIFKWKAFFI